MNVVVCRLLYGDQARYFEQELKPRIKHSKLGQISMVNNGSNMHGSQVAFIALLLPASLNFFSVLSKLKMAFGIL